VNVSHHRAEEQTRETMRAQQQKYQLLFFRPLLKKGASSGNLSLGASSHLVVPRARAGSATASSRRACGVYVSAAVAYPRGARETGASYVGERQKKKLLEPPIFFFFATLAKKPTFPAECLLL
jgi:hypothetical protein